ncbi:3-hydroxyacyl-CoA dehydrogenase NAD-binding domain-containing protein [Streptomyces sp. SDT5-1]|uniref:3-hydroxyacyl-CoA dehydrogenase NAD-binding domain-containing protein n=1 Tax=Streptomyces sp. SDT5-1 TaxID=3406418 RepID=UPI003FD5BE00
MPVALYDPDPSARNSARSRIATGCRLSGADGDGVDALITVHDLLPEACDSATTVFEAAPERLALKQALFAELVRHTAPDTVLASNTSAIPISRIADRLTRPQQVIGTHFWQPPSLVPLVEVVRAAATHQEVAAVITLLSAAGMRPVSVNADVPGAIGNRLQHALKREAIALVAGGVASAEDVDTVVRCGFGRRLPLVGPLEQADLGGCDLTLAIHEILMPVLDTTSAPHPYLVAMCERGGLGARTGRGFYAWKPGEAERRRAEIARGLAGRPLEEPSTDQV